MVKNQHKPAADVSNVMAGRMMTDDIVNGSAQENSVSERGVDSSVLVFSLSWHRYSYTSLLFSSRFGDS